MAPIRRGRVGPALRAPRAAHAGQNRLGESPGAGDHHARPPDLAHRRRDQVGLDELDRDVERGEFGAERARPVLQERFAAAVGGQERGRNKAAEGSHGEDQPTLPRDHARDDELRNAQRRKTIDVDYFFHFFGCGQGEGYWDVVGGAHVVD